MKELISVLCFGMIACCSAMDLKINVIQMGFVRAYLSSRDELQKTPLHNAIANHQKERTELLVKMGAPLELQDIHGDTPLHSAIKEKDLGTVKLLLEMKAPLEIKNGSEETPIITAVSSNHGEIVLMLIKAGANLKVKFGPNGYSLIHSVVISKFPADDILKIVAILKPHIGIDSFDDTGKTALMLAAKANYTIVQGIIDLGASVFLKSLDSHKCTALHFAAKYQALAIRPLYSGGAKLEEEDYHNSTPLYYAYAQKNEDSQKILLELGANKENARVRNAETKTSVLHSLAGSAKTLDEVARLREMLEKLNFMDPRALTQAYELIDVKGPEERTPLHEAAQYNENVTAMQILLEYIPDIDVQDFYGGTPIHYAALNKNSEVLKTLLKAGAKLKISDRRGATALHYAVTGRNMDAITTLLMAGADINACTLAGETPLDIAEQLSLEIECFLIIHGAKVTQSKQQKKIE